MPRKAGQTKEESRKRILASAGRGFRRFGYGGFGVDGLARDAGVTSGAFYASFRSKAEAFRETVETGLRELRTGIEGFRSHLGEKWLPGFIAFYLSERRTCDLGESCALQSLTSEVARADVEVQTVFRTELLQVVSAVAEGVPSGSDDERRKKAIALLALLSGGVTLARAVPDPELAEEIAVAVQEIAEKLFQTADPE